MGFMKDIEDMVRSNEWKEHDKRIDGPTASQKIFSHGLRGLEGIMRRMDQQDMLRMENRYNNERVFRKKDSDYAKDTINKSKRRFSKLNLKEDNQKDDDYDFGF